uniref:Uncharacterized protein n=1 Tax=Tanacetum cinerariifolium TaxID=118510 RepID=A0A699HVY9_TANCI|nr:hypothetical protein [Tanacetum cinerariifolium]
MGYGYAKRPTQPYSGLVFESDNNPGSSSQPPYNQIPYHPYFQTPFANPDELSLFNQMKMQMKQQQQHHHHHHQQQQQQQHQPNQATASLPQSDQQSFHLVNETEDETKDGPNLTSSSKKTSRGLHMKLKAKKTKEKEAQVEAKNRSRIAWSQEEELILAKSFIQISEDPRVDNHKWKNPESTLARKNRLRVIDEDPEHFGDDALPRPPGLQGIAKSQRYVSNSTASSGSNPMMYQEFMKEQYELGRKAKMEVIE